MKSWMKWTLALSSALVAASANATFHTFVIDEVYSNADGTVQYVVLRESQGLDGENLLMGKLFTSTHNGATNTFVFPKNLPGGSCGYYGCTPSPTAGKRVLLATQGFAALGLLTPDFTIPNEFIATDGAEINYAGVDQLTFGSLPTDGVNALNRNGTTGQNLATNFADVTATVVAAPPTVTVIEYYNNILDHYFMTPFANEIALLDAHAPPFQNWARTQLSFQANLAQATASLVPVCRFLIPPIHGDSHFFSAAAADCNFLLMAAADPADNPNFSGYIEETAAAFFVTLPDATGACPSDTVPVFRVWNQRFDSNHRYTANQAIVAQMLARGYVQEGALPNLAVMCAAM